MPPFDIIIPARLASKRLPGKPLRDICGKTLIERVYECACNSVAEQIIVATADPEVEHVAKAFGANVFLTRGEHPSGTDRLGEVVEELDYDDDRIVVNLQGDEPRMPGLLIDQVAEVLALDNKAKIATACRPLVREQEYSSPDVVKVVRDRKGYALYFSRAPVPWGCMEQGDSSDNMRSVIRRHIGIYAYKAGYIKQFVKNEHSLIEQSEGLEQLRALWRGDPVRVVDAVVVPGPGIDTLDDLNVAIQYFS